MKLSKWFKIGLVLTALTGAVVVTVACGTSRAGDTSISSQDPTKSWIPACIGGPVATDQDTAVVRWLGNSCWEVAYRGQVILIDNFYDRGPRAPSPGFTASQVKRADAIFVTHGHKDHMSDTAQVALQTGAPVYCHQTVTDKLLTQGVPATQIHTFQTGADSFSFDGFAVKMIHTYHNTPSITAMTDFKTLLANYAPPSQETLDAEAAINAKGSSSSDIATKGLFSFLFVFDSGFTFLGAESAASPLGWTDEMKTLFSTYKKFDVVAAPCQNGWSPLTDQIVKTWGFLQMTSPRLVLPQHHDVFPDFAFTPTQPLGQKIHDEMPSASFYSQLYREPLVFNVKTQTTGTLMPQAASKRKVVS